MVMTRVSSRVTLSIRVMAFATMIVRVRVRVRISFRIMVYIRSLIITLNRQSNP
jgi:hypothetical protein